MPYNDFLSGKRKDADQPQRDPINRQEADQLETLGRGDVPYNSRLKRAETPEETEMRQRRRKPKV